MARKFAVIIRQQAGGVSSASHLPREHWLTVHRGPEVDTQVFRRAGVSRRVIFRGQGEVGAKLKLSTKVTFAPFNLDLLEISSYEFLIRVHRDQE